MGARISHVVSFAFVAFVAVACGARGPLDLAPDESTLDASASHDSSTNDASFGADASDSAPQPIEDAGVDAPPSPVQCATCIGNKCGTQALACAQSPGCRMILQCVATKCLGGGTPSPSCLAGCAGSDTTALMQAFDVLQCVTNQCGADCLPLLGGGG